MSTSSTQHLLNWLVASPAQPHPSAEHTSPADWDALIAAAVAHTVTPQLFQRLSAESGHVPPQVLQGAFAAAMWQKQQTPRIERDVAAALRTLNAAGLTPILLKGAHLALMIYPDPSHRVMSDLDLFLPTEQMERAERALIDSGFESERKKPIEDWFARSREIAMTKADSIPVELHWAIANPRDCVSIDGLWERSHEVRVLGQVARVLSIEDLLLHICFHAGVTHQFGQKGLRPLFDIVAILDRNGSSLDWTLVEQRARQWRTEKATYLMLRLAREEGRAPVPEHVLTRLKPRSVSTAVYSAARAQMFEPPGVNLYPVVPHSIALTLVSPRLMWNYAFARTSRKRDTVGAEVGMYLSGYARSLWRNLRNDRGKLLLILKRFRRHLILSAWLASQRIST